MAKRIGAFAFGLWLVAGAQTARAGGLVVSGSEGDDKVQVLSPLGNVELSAELDDARAHITESRYYEHVSPVSAAILSGRFYRSLVGPEGTRFEGATLHGRPLEGEVLAPAAADALRRQLVIELGDPAPLRELGAPMFVSEPFEVNNPGYGSAVEVTTSVPLSARGTLMGVDVPLDWSPDDVDLVSLEVSARTEGPLRALYSPYHSLNVTREGEYAATATYRDQAVCTRFDVTLLLSTGDEDLRLDLLPFRYDAADGGHFLALLTPPTRPPEGAVQGRDLVLALDVSGSMDGEKLEQARAALLGVLAGLGAGDRVAVVSFETAVRAAEAQVVPADEENLAAAEAFVAELAAGGGTNIHGALEASLTALPAEETRPRYVVLLTDGQPTEGVTDVDAIVASVAQQQGVRVFPFGIGYDVNTRLLDRLAAETGGQAIYVRPGESVTASVAAFFDRIVDPVLTDPELELEGLGVSALHPAELPDLYAGDTLAVLGRYDAPGTGTLRVTGTGAGDAVTHDFAVGLPEHALYAGFVPRIWALREVGALLSAIKLGEASESAEAKLREVAARYGVVTDFTGYQPDEDGDMRFVYSPVPLAETGAAAVEASASITGYAQGSSAEAGGTGEVRYHRDRPFVLTGGLYADATLSPEQPQVELHYASERYFELVESQPLAAGLLAIAPAVRFEWLGHAYRVTDAGATESLPDEVEGLPDPLRTLALADATMRVLGDGEAPTGIVDGAAREVGDDVAPGDEVAAEPGTEPRHATACSASRAGRTGAAPWWLLGLLGLLGLLAVRRQHR